MFGQIKKQHELQTLPTFWKGQGLHGLCLPSHCLQYKKNVCKTVSIRRTTGFEPFYTTIATVTINRIAAVAIVLLNLYVAVGISCQILQPVWSTHFPDASTSIGAEAAL